MAFEASETWVEYCDIFNSMWGLTKAESNHAGLLGKKIFAAEFKERGPAAYRNSVILPIRNARYSCEVLDNRWGFLKTKSLRGSILDYGCGVGAQLIYLARLGYDNLYGYELPGIQHDVMVKAFVKHNIKVWKDEQVDIILCTNVLEHVTRPVELLSYLHTVGSTVYANICMDTHDSPHIAPHDQLEECRNILKSRGGLYEY